MILRQLCLLILGLWAVAQAADKHDGAYLRDVTMALETPHLAWAKPLAGGPVRALFVAPRCVAAREIVELAQRLDLDFQAVTTANARTLAIESIYDGAIAGTSTGEKEAEILAKLGRRHEVLILGNCDLEILPAEAKYRILQQVAEGAGLVIAYPTKLPYAKLFARPDPEGTAAIQAMLGREGLPAKAQAVADGTLLKTYRFGEGRVAVLDYRSPHPANYGGLSLTAPDSYSPLWKARYENSLALVARTVLWAAGRTLRGDAIQAPCAAGTTATATAFAQMQILRVQAVPATGARLLLRLRDAWNAIELESELPLAAGQTEVAWQPPRLKAGRHLLDARVRSAQGVEAFGSWSFTIVSPVGEAILAPTRPSFEKGAHVTATLRLETPPPAGAQLRLSLIDAPYGRIWLRSQQDLPAGQQEVAIDLAPIPFPTLAGRLVAEIVAGDDVLVRAETVIFFPERSLEPYVSIGWDCVPADHLAPFVAQQVVERLGWRAGLTRAINPATVLATALSDQRLMPYMARVMLGVSKDQPGWTALDGCWWNLPAPQVKQDVAALQGDLSFYNPAVQALARASMTAQTRILAQAGPPVYSLGDENHFTYDLGFSPSDDAEFHRFLAARYGDIASLNRAWDATYPDFAAVRHLSQAEALQARNYPAWFDHGAFVEKQYADVHHALAAWIKETDPHARVGAEGSVPGDLELTISKLDFWGPYSDPVMDEVLRSIGGSRLRTLWWGGYVGSHGGRNSYPLPLWQPLLTGAVNGSAWFSASVSAEGLLGADLSFPRYVNELLPRLLALQGGLAQLLVTAPLTRHGIAIRYDHRSGRAPQADARCFSPLDSSNTLQDFAYRQGLGFDYLPSSAIRAGRLAGSRILFLFGASVIDQAEAEAIRAFAAAGGVVVADLNPGLLDGHGRPLARPQLADLFPGAGFADKAQPMLRPLTAQATVRSRDLRLDADKTYASSEIPALTVTEVGKGLAVLLNFNLSAARGGAAAATPFDRFLLDLMALAGVKPEVAVAGVDAERLVVRLRDVPGGRLLGLLTDPKDVGRKITVTLPAPAVVYRAGGGRLAQGAAFADTLDEPFKVYFLADRETPPPSVVLDRDTVGLGGSVTLDLAPLAAGGVYRLELLGPDSRPLPQRTRVLTLDGQRKAEPVHLACSDLPGGYAVRLTDLRTGLDGTTAFSVR